MRAGEDTTTEGSPPSAGSRWEEVANLIRGGVSAAETEFVRIFYPQAMTVCFDRLRDLEMAREVTQETMLAVLSALRVGRLREPEKLPAFVLGTARNLAHNVIRKRGRQGNSIPIRLDENTVANPGDSTSEAELEGRERRDIVRSALLCLSPTDRTILRFTLVEGWNPREIAPELGLKPEVVRNRKSRAIKTIRKIIGKMIRTASQDHIY